MCVSSSCCHSGTKCRPLGMSENWESSLHFLLWTLCPPQPIHHHQVLLNLPPKHITKPLFFISTLASLDWATTTSHNSLLPNFLLPLLTLPVSSPSNSLNDLFMLVLFKEPMIILTIQGLQSRAWGPPAQLSYLIWPLPPHCFLHSSPCAALEPSDFASSVQAVCPLLKCSPPSLSFWLLLSFSVTFSDPQIETSSSCGTPS